MTENRRQVDWLKLTTKLEHASKNPKVSPTNQKKAAVSARRLRAFKPLRDKVMKRERPCD
jgi:hypothetical protein